MSCKSKMFCKARETEFEAEGPEDCRDGETVTIEMDKKKTILSVLVVFAIPLSFMLAGMLAGRLLFRNEAAEAALSIVMLAAGFPVSAAIGKKLPLIPRITNRQDTGTPER